MRAATADSAASWGITVGWSATPSLSVDEIRVDAARAPSKAALMRVYISVLDLFNYNLRHCKPSHPPGRSKAIRLIKSYSDDHF